MDPEIVNQRNIDDLTRTQLKRASFSDIVLIECRPGKVDYHGKVKPILDAISSEAFVAESCARLLIVDKKQNIDNTELSKIADDIKVFDGIEAYEHMLNVVCGLKSHRIGETHVRGQMLANWADFSSRNADKSKELQGFISDVIGDSRIIYNSVSSAIEQDVTMGKVLRSIISPDDANLIVLSDGIADTISLTKAIGADRRNKAANIFIHTLKPEYDSGLCNSLMKLSDNRQLVSDWELFDSEDIMAIASQYPIRAIIYASSQEMDGENSGLFDRLISEATPEYSASFSLEGDLDLSNFKAENSQKVTNKEIHRAKEGILDSNRSILAQAKTGIVNLALLRQHGKFNRKLAEEVLYLSKEEMAKIIEID